MLDPNVLVVDDHPATREATVRVLRDRGLKAAGVGGGQEALEALQAAPYDLVLMDIVMPGVNGLDAARKIRDLDLRVVIVAVTGYDTPAIETTCREAGISEVLPKPLDVDALCAVLKLV